MQVAYVLGQLQNKTATATLSEVLKNVDEHPMVRHEAAEALGSIAGISAIGSWFYINFMKSVDCINLLFGTLVLLKILYRNVLCCIVLYTLYLTRLASTTKWWWCCK